MPAWRTAAFSFDSRTCMRNRDRQWAVSLGGWAFQRQALDRRKWGTDLDRNAAGAGAAASAQPVLGGPQRGVRAVPGKFRSMELSVSEVFRVPLGSRRLHRVDPCGSDAVRNCI